MGLIHGYLLYLLLRSLDLGRECTVRYRLYLLYLIGYQIRIGYYYLPGLFFTKVVELP